MDRSASDRRVAEAATADSNARSATRPANYNCPMARGWESKSVESQQADASEKSDKPHAKMNELRPRRKESPFNPCQLSEKQSHRGPVFHECDCDAT